MPRWFHVTSIIPNLVAKEWSYTSNIICDDTSMILSKKFDTSNLWPLFSFHSKSLGSLTVTSPTDLLVFQPDLMLPFCLLEYNRYYTPAEDPRQKTSPAWIFTVLYSNWFYKKIRTDFPSVSQRLAPCLERQESTRHMKKSNFIRENATRFYLRTAFVWFSESSQTLGLHRHLNKFFSNE
jgi:hypothetical protein